MRWVHLRINTRVRVLGRRTEQHARGPVKNRRPLFTVQNWAADLKKLARLCRRAAQHVIYTVFTVKNVEDAHGSSNTLVVKSRPVVRRLKILRYASIHL